MKTVIGILFLMFIPMYTFAGMGCDYRGTNIECYCPDPTCTSEIKLNTAERNVRISCVHDNQKYMHSWSSLHDKGLAHCKKRKYTKQSVKLQCKKSVDDEVRYKVQINCSSKCKHNCPSKGPGVAKLK